MIPRNLAFRFPSPITMEKCSKIMAKLKSEFSQESVITIYTVLHLNQFQNHKIFLLIYEYGISFIKIWQVENL